MNLARNGDRCAFEELVRRRQSWIRNLLRRCCGNATLADDLAQQVFLQAWWKIRHIQQANRFGAWLKSVTIRVWLQHLRKQDPLKDAEIYEQSESIQRGGTVAVAMDLDRALATLPKDVRLCIVLSYHERMTHGEIATFTGLPLGTIKSHIRRGTQHLQQLLSAYRNTPCKEQQL